MLINKALDTEDRRHMLTTSVLSKGKEKCLYVGGYTAVVKSLYLFGTHVSRLLCKLTEGLQCMMALFFS